MQLIWYDLTRPKGENRVLILADRPMEEATEIEPCQFIGFIERDRSGTWLCYTHLDGRRYVGFEPNKPFAKARVLREIRKEIQSRLELVAEQVKRSRKERGTLQDIGQGDDE